ncbi:hypothetical protein HYE68_008453 [Fusarium pseudograminearum]|nr:hypothetical protein HYE68_008453 [Fusarium pseudograminearum]
MASPKPNDTEIVDASKLTEAPPKPTTSIKNALNAFMAKSIPVYKSIDAVLRAPLGYIKMPETLHDPKLHREILQSINLRETAEDFSPTFSVLVSINGIPISRPNASEACYFSDIENGSLHMSANFRPATRDYSTFHISCYAYGFGIDETRLGSLTVFARDFSSVSCEKHPEPDKSLEEYCSGAKPASDPVMVTLKAKTAQFRLPRGILNKLTSLHATRASEQLETIRDELSKNTVEIKLLVPGHKLMFAKKFTDIIEKFQKLDAESDPLSTYFEHAPQAKTFCIDHAPKPGSEEFPRPQDIQLVHFANAEQHLIHNICSVIWEQLIQDHAAHRMFKNTFKAIIVPLPEKDTDALIVKVGGQMGLFPQVGETCTVTIAKAVFKPRSASPVDQTAAFKTFFQLLLMSSSQRLPLQYLNENCSELARPLSETEYELFCRTQEEKDAVGGIGDYQKRTRSLCNAKSDFFKSITGSQKPPSDDDEHVDEDSKKSFRGGVRNVTDRNIPPEYRVITIRRPRGFDVSLPYVELNGSESLADYLSRVEDEDLEKITLQTDVSNKTLKAQSLAMNSLKYPPSAQPFMPSDQSIEAYNYLINFDRNNTKAINLLEELPGVGNVVTNKAGPPSIQAVFDKLPLQMKRCLTDMSESFARLHFISGVAGSGKSYLMEALMLFTMFGDGDENRPKRKILYILNNNVQVEMFCQRLAKTFEDWGFSADGAKPIPNIMRLYPFAGELRSTESSFNPKEEEIEAEDMAKELRMIESLQATCANILACDSTAKLARNANRDKSLHQFGIRHMEQDLERYQYMDESIYRIRNGELLDKEKRAYFRQGLKTLYRDAITDFSGIVVTTAVGATPLPVREQLDPDLVIIDEAATMDEPTLLIPICHYSPKAFVITGDIAQKPPHLTREHDLGHGKISSNPFMIQKQVSTILRVVEGGAKHSTLNTNMRAHGNVADAVNNLFYNGIMQTTHGWTDMTSLKAIIAWFTENVNKEHPLDQCFAQVEFTHARVTQRSSSKVNVTHAKWIIQQALSLVQSGLTGVGKNSGKPLTVLVVAAYKQQVCELRQILLDKTRELNLNAVDVNRIRLRTIDNAQGDEADFVFYDMVTTSTPAFVAADFRCTLGLSRSTAFLVVLANRGNFIGHEKNETTQGRAQDLARVYEFFAKRNVNKRIKSCKKCETHDHTTDDCTADDINMSDKSVTTPLANAPSNISYVLHVEERATISSTAPRPPGASGAPSARRLDTHISGVLRLIDTVSEMELRGSVSNIEKAKSQTNLNSSAATVTNKATRQ